MIPVLAVKDPVAACGVLEFQLGFRKSGEGRMSFGDQEIAVVEAGRPPAALMDLRLDHVAFQVPDVEATQKRCEARGAKLCKAFTPDGPVEIPEFWDAGVRFVFFDGPDGWPFEFCAKLGIEEKEQPEGHGHFAIRTKELDKAGGRLEGIGAGPTASHRLGTEDVVSVRFMHLGDKVFELFDEGPFPEPPETEGWIGLIPA